jgi:hypothetical protein
VILSALGGRAGDRPHRAIPLSPFDSLVWISAGRAFFHRQYLLEVYKPAHQLAFRYFGMPVWSATAWPGAQHPAQPAPCSSSKRWIETTTTIAACSPRRSTASGVGWRESRGPTRRVRR